MTEELDFFAPRPRPSWADVLIAVLAVCLSGALVIGVLVCLRKVIVG